MNESIKDKMKEMFGSLSTNYNILEDQINVELQVEYFELSAKFKKDLDEEQAFNDREKLFDSDYPDDERKILLNKLAKVKKVEAYRAIEKFVKDADNKLHDWAVYALQESRMHIESMLLDQNQIFISTGLGGKGSKLRYFVVLRNIDDKEFSEIQKKIIKSEFKFTLQKHDSEIEEIGFDESFATLLSLVPMEKSVKSLFTEAVNQCNQLGEFISASFIITNVQKMSTEEIKTFLKKHNSKKTEK